MSNIDWQKTPLIPVVVQEASSKDVLMLAYANQEAYELTIQTGYAHYYSRSREKLWKKGEESGHLQKIVEVLSDCDSDTLLYKVDQHGVACHTGRHSCFFVDELEGKITSDQLVDTDEIYHIIDILYHTIKKRIASLDSSSYVASLIKKGENSILKKVVEEAGEFAFAVKDSDEKEIIYEASDLIFHLLVALGYKDINPSKIFDELKRRQGIGGLEEKAKRNS